MVVGFPTNKNLVEVLYFSDVEKRLAKMSICPKFKVLDHPGRAFLMLVGLVQHVRQTITKHDANEVNLKVLIIFLTFIPRQSNILF